MQGYLICLEALVGDLVKENAFLDFVSLENKYQSFLFFVIKQIKNSSSYFAFHTCLCGGNACFAGEFLFCGGNAKRTLPAEVYGKSGYTCAFFLRHSNSLLKMKIPRGSVKQIRTANTYQ